MTTLNVAKAVAREALATITQQQRTIKVQRWAIVFLAIALAISLMVIVCASKM